MKKMHGTQVVSSLLVLAVSVMALTLALGVVIDYPALAGPPDQGPGRYAIRPSCRPRRYRSVLGLHRTVRYTAPPDDPGYNRLYGPFPCDSAVAAEGAEFWMVKPSPDLDDDIDIFLEDPYAWPGVVVWICSGDQDTTYELTGPGERTFPLEPAFATGAGDDAAPYAYVYEFFDACKEGQEPPDCSLTGTYRLTIKSSSAEYPAKHFRVEAYDGPRIEAQEIQSSDTGQALEIQYVDFYEGEGSIRACLYHDDEEFAEDFEEFVKSWEVPPGPDDEYRDELPITDEMAEGEYTLIGVQDVAISCPLILDALAVAYLAGQDPPAAYWRFALGLDEEEPGRVYINHGWAPGCDRALALQLPGQWGCGPEVTRHDMDWLTDQLREQGLLEADEWLEVVPLRPWRREALAIRGEAGSQLGWIRIGGSVPGSVWRTTYYPPGEQVGKRCWLGTDYVGVCQE